MKTLLLTGGSGLLGLNWARTMAVEWSVHLIMHSRVVAVAGAENQAANLGSRDALMRLLDAIEPDLVVNAAGLTNIELCEKEPETAALANVRIPANVAECCAGQGVRLVHISTDHLFAGTEPMLSEDEPVRPLNVYARTKADGETAVLDAWPDALVARTNFYGWGPTYRRSFSDRIVDALRRGEETVLFEDVHFTPILVDALAETVHDLVARDAHGVYHVVGDERLSKHEFGLRIADVFGLDKRLIRPGRIAELSNLVVRPLEMSLSNRKGSSQLGRDMGGVSSQLHRLAVMESDPRVKEIQAL